MLSNIDKEFSSIYSKEEETTLQEEEGFCCWVKLLYNDPNAKIITNNNISKPVKIQRGRRQGCPVSPLLFIITIEPFTIAVREHVTFPGEGIGGIDLRAFYACFKISPLPPPPDFFP